MLEHHTNNIKASWVFEVHGSVHLKTMEYEVQLDVTYQIVTSSWTSYSILPVYLVILKIPTFSEKKNSVEKPQGMNIK
jgi:hypothetical protein